MVVDSNQAPDTPRPNQPAAQPPAVVEQGAQLPAKTKAKPGNGNGKATSGKAKAKATSKAKGAAKSSGSKATADGGS